MVQKITKQKIINNQVTGYHGAELINVLLTTTNQIIDETNASSDKLAALEASQTAQAGLITSLQILTDDSNNATQEELDTAINILQTSITAGDAGLQAALDAVVAGNSTDEERLLLETSVNAQIASNDADILALQQEIAGLSEQTFPFGDVTCYEFFNDAPEPNSAFTLDNTTGGASNAGVTFGTSQIFHNPDRQIFFDTTVLPKNARIKSVSMFEERRGSNTAQLRMQYGGINSSAVNPALHANGFSSTRSKTTFATSQLVDASTPLILLDPSQNHWDYAQGADSNFIASITPGTATASGGANDGVTTSLTGFNALVEFEHSEGGTYRVQKWSDGITRAIRDRDGQVTDVTAGIPAGWVLCEQEAETIPFAKGVEVEAFPSFTAQTLVTASTSPTQAIDLGVDLSNVDFLDVSITANNSGEETRRLDLREFKYDQNQGGLLHWWDANGIRVRINTSDISTGRIYVAYLTTSSMRIERIRFRKLVDAELPVFPSLHRAKLKLVADTALVTATTTQLPFDTVEYDVGSIADIVNNQVVIVNEGLYDLHATIFNMNQNRVAQLFIEVNGNLVARNISSITNGDQTVGYSPQASTKVELAPGDIVTVGYYAFTATTTSSAMTELTVTQLSTSSVINPSDLPVSNLNVTDGDILAWNATSGQYEATSVLGNISQIGHTHTEADITDLDKYTQAEVDAKDTALQAQIDNITTLLNSDDTTLDELQEVVDFIKQNKTDLDTLGIANIAGLQSALDAKLEAVNLSTTQTATAVTVVNDSGSDAVIPAATITEAGAMNAADKDKVDRYFNPDGVVDGTELLVQGGQVVPKNWLKVSQSRQTGLMNNGNTAVEYLRMPFTTTSPSQNYLLNVSFTWSTIYTFADIRFEVLLYPQGGTTPIADALVFLGRFPVAGGTGGVIDVAGGGTLDRGTNKVTENQGYFSIDNLPAGNWEVSLSYQSTFENSRLTIITGLITVEEDRGIIL